MGCITSKSSAVDDSREGLSKDLGSSKKRNFEKKVSRSDSKKRVEGVLEKDTLLDGIGMKVSLIDKEANNGSVWLYDDQNEKKKMEKPELAVVVDCPRIGRVPKALEGEQVAAGWPTWLSSVAGEAINGWIPRSAHTFEKYDKVSKLQPCLLSLWLYCD
jgi:cyclin-dependent kinase 12/13